ncbi:MAG: hypothetical protein KGQ60_12085 [Planctomycetes bacterium]|nr:hypothetical protein [Planctomycetota bacterium]
MDNRGGWILNLISGYNRREDSLPTPTRDNNMRMSVISLFLLLVFSQKPIQAMEPSLDLSGRWPSGFWRSDTSGHRGPLRANFRQQDNGNYRVIFYGRFWGVIPFRYGVTLEVTGHQGDRVLMSGSSRLGPILGTFTYQAEANATDFQATFNSRREYGVFNLKRD